MRCAACGQIIRTLGNEKYCCKKCRSDKPPKLLEIEKEYNKIFEVVAVEVLNKTNSITSTADILGITRKTLYQYIQQYNIIKSKYRWVVG